MDWDRIAGQWKEFRSKAKRQWGELTDDELLRIAGRQEQLIGKLQERYGYSRDLARREVERWATDASHTAEQEPANFPAGFRQVIGNVNSALRTSLKTNPRETLALAAVVGFVLGALWRSRNRAAS